MRILFAIPSFEIGGAERIFLEIARGLKARGHVSGLLVRAENVGRGTAEYPTDAFEAVHPVDRPAWLGRAIPAAILAAYDLVHLTLFGPEWRAAFQDCGRPVVHTVHSIVGYSLWYTYGLAQGERVAALTTVDRQTAAYVSDILPGVRVRHIPNGVEIKPGTRNPASQGDAMASPGRGTEDRKRGTRNTERGTNGETASPAGVPSSEFRAPGLPAVVGTVGRISPWAKHHVMFARVAGLVQRRAREAGLVEPVFRIIGGTRPEDRPLEDRIQAAAKAAGGRIEITGYLPADRVREELAKLSVFCLTSSSEGSPLALLEAMAAGLPCVATAVGGVPEILPPYRDRGVLVTIDDDEAMAEAVEMFLANPGVADRVGRRGREHVLAHHRLDQMVQAYEDLYEEILA